MNSVVHNFVTSLAWSNQMSDEGAWVEFYRHIWPEALQLLRIDSKSQWQTWGVDRMVLFPNGKQITVDEKKRNTRYTDVLLEEVSVYYGPNDPKNKVGWSLDAAKRIDYVAYAIPLANICYLLPFELTRLAYVAHKEAWHRTAAWYPKVAQNDGYKTINCAVPWPILKAAVAEQMHRHFGDGVACPLPKPEVVVAGSKQAVFVWPEDR